MRRSLEAWIKRDAIMWLGKEHGEFQLKSGEKSSYYIDLRKVTLHTHGLRSIAGIIHNMMEEVDAIGGPCVGADPIIGALLWMSYPIGRRGFLVRKEEKNHGIGGLIIGSVRPKDKCVLIDDVTSSGGSLLRACQVVQEFGCEIVEVISVVDRNAGAKELFEKNGIKFSFIFSMDELLE